MTELPPFLTFAPDCADMVIDSYKRALLSGNPVAVELRHNGTDRERVWFLGHYVGDIISTDNELAVSAFREQVFGKCGAIPHAVAARAVKATDAQEEAFFRGHVLDSLRTAD